MNIFSMEEVEDIDMVTKCVQGISTWDIVDLSHKEKSWKELEPGKELIGYQDHTFELAAI